MYNLISTSKYVRIDMIEMYHTGWYICTHMIQHEHPHLWIKLVKRDLERSFSSWQDMLPAQRTRIQFPEPKSGSSAAWNSRSRGSDTLSWPWSVHTDTYLKVHWPDEPWHQPMAWVQWILCPSKEGMKPFSLPLHRSRKAPGEGTSLKKDTRTSNAQNKEWVRKGASGSARQISPRTSEVCPSPGEFWFVGFSFSLYLWK